MKRIFFAICCLWLLVAAKAEDRITVPAALKSVTIYRSGAEMTHTATALLKQGNNVLVIEKISNAIDINSIQINAGSGVTIMGVEFSNNYLAPAEKTPRIKLLEDSLESINKSIKKTELSITNVTDLLNVLNANRDIKGTQTGLSVAELMKLMNYYKTKSLELQNELAQLTEKKEKSEMLYEKISNQLEEEQNKNVATDGRLTLQLAAATAGKTDFTISYIAKNAFWEPFYDVRADNITSPLRVIYKAKITQTTGIDWKQVKLSLSTSVPTQWGDAPVFKQWFLGYINPVRAMNQQLSSNYIQSMDAELSEVVVNGYGAEKKDLSGSASGIRLRGAPSISTAQKPLYVVNGAIMSAEDFSKISQSSIKSMEVLKDASATAIYGSRAAGGAIVVTLKSGLEDYVSVADNTLNVTFDIDMPYDIASTGKEQTAVLKTLEVPCSYKHYAVPKLDKDAYLLAEVPSWQQLNLLPGQANIIFEGTYVGKSFIDPNSTQDTLNLTLGRDKRVAIKRDKLIDFSSVKFMGSNKLQKFTYELTVKNNKNETVNLLLKDQFPLSTSKEIEVELIDAGGAAINTDIGVLTWKLSLAPAETKKLRFSYSIKYPKDRTLNL